MYEKMRIGLVLAGPKWATGWLPLEDVGTARRKYQKSAGLGEMGALHGAKE